MERQHSSEQQNSQGKPRDDQRFLSDCFESMLFLKFAPTDRAAIEGWKYAAGKVLARVGRQAFRRAVEIAMTSNSEFPTPGQLEENAPKYAATEVVDELRELRKRKDSGERFFGLQDLAQDVRLKAIFGKTEMPS